MKKICGKCSHFYCGNCKAHNTSVDVLEDGCGDFNKFNAYEYRTYVNQEMKI